MRGCDFPNYSISNLNLMMTFLVSRLLTVIGLSSSLICFNASVFASLSALHLRLVPLLSSLIWL